MAMTKSMRATFRRPMSVVLTLWALAMRVDACRAVCVLCQRLTAMCKYPIQMKITGPMYRIRSSAKLYVCFKPWDSQFSPQTLISTVKICSTTELEQTITMGRASRALTNHMATMILRARDRDMKALAFSGFRIA